MIEEDIVRWCFALGIFNYKLRQEHNRICVDVNGNVDLAYKKLNAIPIKFGIVNGQFDCGSNYLQSLDCSPDEVGDNFICSFNKLTSLKASPKIVGGSFKCHSNELTSLEGFPHMPNVIDEFSISGNNLNNFDYLPIVNGTLWCYRNHFSNDSFEKLFKDGFEPDNIKCDEKFDIKSLYRKWIMKQLLL